MCSTERNQGMVEVVETLRRGLDILTLIQHKGPISQAEIARETGLSKAVVHRLLHTLREAGFVRVALGDQLWRATGGPANSVASDPNEALARAALPVLEELCETVFWPSDVAVYSNGAMRIVEHTRRNTPFVISRIVAPRIHVLQSGLGRAQLTWATPADRERILSDLRSSPHSRDAPACNIAKVDQLIRDTRARGYATRDPSHFGKARRSARISEIALPVGPADAAVAAINLCWATSAMSESEFTRENLPFLTQAASRIWTELNAIQKKS